ncbi:MAG: DUF3025 domain-containing protein [Comamonadaceae bacterium]|nr:MAG: DUF3025 domain-containing protein [Comamonadaceae bacterium]
MQPLFESIDWQRPWLSHLERPRGPDEGPVFETLGCPGPDGVEFVAHSALPAGTAYERFVHETRTIPTRDNLHDFFNGLVWLHFPLSKRRMNELQAGEIARVGIGGRGGPVRDALTLLDENGALLDAPDALWQALLARDWHALFVTHRPLWRQARLMVFGHALLEQLLRPRKGLTAHVLCAPPAVMRGCRNAGVARWDAALREALDPAWLAGKPFTPLPVLGVPGWWAGNENFSFYDDSEVFRPAGRHKNPQPQVACTRSPS